MRGCGCVLSERAVKEVRTSTVTKVSIATAPFQLCSLRFEWALPALPLTGSIQNMFSMWCCDVGWRRCDRADRADFPQRC
jgi:hypothetical protein